MRKLLIYWILFLSIAVSVTPGGAAQGQISEPGDIAAVAEGTVTAQTLALASSQAITPADFKVAFIGDQGMDENARAVLQLILDEGTDMVMHQGDLSYDEGTPAEWDQMVTDVLGADFPYFASIGDHEDQDWDEYQQVLSARLALVPGASCSGELADLGLQSSCTYQGLFFILSSIGTPFGSVSQAHDEYIRDELALDNSIWSVCSWHKNEREMQVGGKLGETGWEVYEECRLGGAIIATADEHSYSRTKTLTSTELQTVDPDWPQAGEVRVTEGSTFVFVSGLGGRSIRDQERCLPDTPPYGCNGEWASIYTENQGANHGALFCSFHVDGQPNKADCYFKDISGNIPDSFSVTSFLGPAQGSPPLTTDDDATTIEDMAVATDVMANDLDPDGDTLLLLSFDAASTNGGTVTRLDGGTPGDTSDDQLLYTPAPNFNNVDSYAYAVSDGVFTVSATVTVTVDPVDDPPVAVDDPESTSINTPVTTDVLANDSDPDGDPLFLDSFDALSTEGGSVSRDDGGTPGNTGDDQLVYTPPPGFTGDDTYGYTVADNQGGFASAMVTVTVVETVTLSGPGDAFTRASRPDKNFGSKSFMRVKASDERDGFAQFDVSGLNGTVTSAVLNLPIQDVSTAGNLKISAIQAPWDEQTITHNNKPSVNAVPAATTSISASDTGTTIQVDLTSLVQQWAALPGTAHGVALTAADSLNVVFDTKEGAGGPFIELSVGGSGNAVPVVEITAPDNNDTFTEGDEVVFSGTATDLEEGDLTSSLTWSSSLDGEIGSSGSVSTSSLSVGSHLITASVTDMGGAGATGSDSITVHVTSIGGETMITLSGTGDSFTRGSRPDKNFGTRSFMRVKASGEKVSFAQFDVSGLNGTVTSAILHLPVQDVSTAGNLNISAIGTPWDEQVITHNNKPSVNAVPAATTSIASSDTGTTIQVDLTSLVQQWAAMPGTAHGVALTAADSLHVLFDTKEGAGAPFIEVALD